MRIYGHFTTSVKKALYEIDPKYLEYRGVVICGSHSPKDANIADLLSTIQYAREHGTPILGICFGYQLMAIEYARNVLGQEYATSEEFTKEGDHVVTKLPELRVGLIDGESYWHRYEVNPGLIHIMLGDENVATDRYMGVQYHPEYQSSIDKPHPILVNFLDICRNSGK